MTTSYFDKPPRKVEHPRLYAWNSYESEPEVKSIAVSLHRPREAFGWGPATLHVFFEGGGRLLHNDSAPWDLDLDRWLVEHHAKARTREAEVTRTAIRLKAYLEPVFQPLGEGYANALIIHVVKAGPLASDPSVHDLLAKHRENRPYDGGKLAEYFKSVENVFRGIAGELTQELEYPREEAERLLGDAVAQYLDERFHITERVRLFGR